MHSEWQFEPDGLRAEAFSAEIHFRLMQSLEYVFGELGTELGGDPGAFDRWLGEARSAKRLAPLGHTLFHSIVAEVEAGRMDRVKALAARLTTIGAAPEGLNLYRLEDDPESDHPLVLFSRFADVEEDNRLDFQAPSEEAVAAFRRLFEQGWGLICEHDPLLEGEFRGLVAEVLIAGQADTHLFTTAAVSCFQNWGGLIVNPAVAHEPLDIVELVAHEATHLLLFALALDEPLLTNPAHLRYYSPLRDAPRSMDGVFHATIVAARIVRAMLRQAEGQGQTPELRRAALNRAEGAVELFRDGVGVIEKDAMLTGTGQLILDRCKDYVDGVKLSASPEPISVDA